MSYDDGIAVRESLLAQVRPMIDRYRSNLDIRHWDIQLQTWSGTNELINAWCLILITAGALLGRKNDLSYVWTFGMTPHVPDGPSLDAGVKEACNRLRIMRTRQLQQQAPPNAGGQSTN